MHKRLITILATLLCVAAFAFGLVACNNTVAVESVTLDKTSVTLQVGGEETLTATVTPDIATNKALTWSSDNTAVATVANRKVTAVSAGTATVTATAGGKSATCVVTVETVKTVTSEQWKQAMESADKFVIEMKQGEMTSAIKIDGDKCMQVAGNAMSLRVKEVTGDETVYFEYYTNGNEWVKQVIDESDYSQTVMYAEISTYFKDDFSSLSYADGKYTAATLDKTSSPFVSVLSDVEITFEDGALTGMKFVVEGMSVEIKEIGTTNITVPTEYIDNTAPVAGITEEEWVRIFTDILDPEKTGGNMTLRSYVLEDGADDYSLYEIFKYNWEDKTFEYAAFDNGSQSDHYYAVYEDRTVYDFTQSGSEQWNKNKWYDASSAKEFFINAYDGVYLDLFVDAFANFSFDKDINAYVGEIDDTTTIVTITDGKIVSVVVGTDKLEFSDYGTTVINLPKAA